MRKHPKTLIFNEIKEGMLDGIDYINVYSKSENILGRLLSNFAYTPFTYKCVRYGSVEAFWYCTTTGNYRAISHLAGWRAKQYGNSFPQISSEPKKHILKKVYFKKVLFNPTIEALLLQNNLPFTHYYVFNNVKVSADKYLWTADLWRVITDELKNKK